MIIKQTIAGLACAIAAGAVSAADLPAGDPISAKIFLELHSFQQLSGSIEPLVSVPGEAFRVLDGDFLALGHLRIRLVGIDAPETAQQCNTAEGAFWECAVEAEDRVRSLMRMAERVECFSDEQDSYGNYLASCKADGRDVGAVLVGEGLAWPDQEQGYYGSEAATAQAGEIGIWQAATQPPWEWRKEQN
ncbi:Succinoglycan biosynthesis protein ExoI [Phaeobacter sp. CECT 5382]|uniref:thermonuclease family protein n=1 Tax=Rhodobacterales TaxID=204455 RepID=UPI0006DAE1D7|nr:thermonuclease family protein [Phaeobacter sp. CECT 5382]CUH89490.1 Succinoglycan biosynthesis protein ExoI [Phaeobacter sp. CECT 5382]